MTKLEETINKIGCNIEIIMWAVVEYRLKTKDKSSNLKEIETTLDDMIFSVKRCTEAINNYINECPEVNTNKFSQLTYINLKEE